MKNRGQFIQIYGVKGLFFYSSRQIVFEYRYFRKEGERMLQVGDCVVSGVNGVCKIEDEVWENNWSGEKTLYYLLIPVEEKGSKMFIPVEHAEEKVRAVMTKEKAQALLQAFPTLPDLVIENEKFCEKEYKAAVYSGDPYLIAQTVKTIHDRMKKRQNTGKKTTTVDERYYAMAMHILASEMAYVLGCEEEDVEKNINDSITK